MVSKTAEDLAASLWRAFDALRESTGSLVNADHIFALLALARISERSDAIDRSDQHALSFVVPAQARWSSIRSHDLEAGRALDRACLMLERANRSLLGVLTPFDFENQSLGDGSSRQQLLTRLIGYIDQVALSTISNDDMGVVSERLLERLAEHEGRRGGEFMTPPSLTHLMVDIADLQNGTRICDPVCGVGSTLAACGRRARALYGQDARLVLHGQEKNMKLAAFSRIVLLLNGFVDVRIEVSDVLRYPMLVQDGRLFKYDRIIADPPMSLADWGAERAAEDPFGRFPFVPPQDLADYAFIQHCMSSLNEGGMAVVLASHGVLFRGGSEEKIRQSMVEEDGFEAIIGLPQGLHYRTAIPPVLLILSRDKPASRRGKILFVDAAHLGRKGGRRNILLPHVSDKIVSLFRDFQSEDRISRVVEVAEIRQKGWSLSIESYIEQAEIGTAPSLDEQIDSIRSAEELRDQAAHRMDTLIGRLKRSFPFDA